MTESSKEMGIVSSYSPAQFERDMRYGTGGSLEIILKVTERCNIACTYCYFFFSADQSYKSHPTHLPEEVVEGLARFIRDGRRLYDLRRVRLILHGGEPLLLKRHRMIQLLEAVRDACVGIEFQPALQTNGMLVDDEWINVFHRFGVYVGVSVDGPKSIHDEFRVDKRGRGTYDRTLRGIHLLQQAYAQGKLPGSPGLLCVINPERSPREIYEHCIRELGFTNVDFLLPDSNHDSTTPEQSKKMAEFVAEIQRLYRRETDARVRIRLIDSAVREINLPPVNASLLARFLSQKELVFTIASNGDIAPDDILRTTDPTIMTTGLNITSATLTDVLLSPVLGRLTDLSFSVPSDCMGCTWMNVCRGGHLYHRFSSANGFDNRSVYCEALQALYTGVSETFLLAGGDYRQLDDRIGRTLAPVV